MNNKRKREKLVANSKKIVADINQLYNEMLQLLSDEYIFDESEDSLDLSEAMSITRRLSSDFMTSSKKVLRIIETGENLHQLSDEEMKDIQERLNRASEKRREKKEAQANVESKGEVTA